MSFTIATVLFTSGVLLVVVSLLPLVPSNAWWVRCWEFPRVQIAVLCAAVAAAIWLFGVHRGPVGAWLAGALVVAAVYQAVCIFPYTRFAPREVAGAHRTGGHPSVTVMVSNVLMQNRDASGLLRLVRELRPDILIAVETDSWWVGSLDPLTDTLPHTVAVPQDNTYGMLVLSLHPLVDTEVDFLVEDDIPSIHTTVELPEGGRVRVHAIHPKPPAPSEAAETTGRDAELVLVGRRAAGFDGPVVVAGDLNDVAWSPTTTLFQKISHLLDPRKGRGFLSSFHAGIPFVRWPLDHVFHSCHFTLGGIRRLPNIGSDHFPILVQLVLEPRAVEVQEAPEAGPEARRAAAAVLQAGSGVLC